MSSTEKSTRRRGLELETAILEAARDELLAEGYGGFTIEGVASRAATSRHVLYRRWRTREELALAAWRHDTLAHPVQVPDTGSLRDDIVALLVHANETRISMAAIFSVQLGAYYQESGMSPEDLRTDVLGDRVGSLDVIVERAVQRGDIDAAGLTPRRRTLAADLFRHEVLMTLRPVPRQAIEEITDIALEVLGVKS